MENVQLILLFDIYNVIKASRHSYVDLELVGDETNSAHGGATLTEREIQTDLHPVPYNKNAGYVWNLWDLRRKAIELVTALKCFLWQLLTFFFAGKPPSEENNLCPDPPVLPQARHRQPAPRTSPEVAAN